MKIVLFESFEENSLNVKYEIMEIRKNGDIEDFFSGDDNYFDFNPYDLVEVVEYMMKYEDEYKGSLFINKLTSERVSDEELEKAKISIEDRKSVV